MTTIKSGDSGLTMKFTCRTPLEQRRHVWRIRATVLAGALLLVLAGVLGGIVGSNGAGQQAPDHIRGAGNMVPLCSSLPGAPFPTAAIAYGCVEIGPNGILIGHIVNQYRCRDGSPLTLMVDDDDLALTEYAHGDEPVKIGTGYTARKAADACRA